MYAVYFTGCINKFLGIVSFRRSFSSDPADCPLLLAACCLLSLLRPENPFAAKFLLPNTVLLKNLMTGIQQLCKFFNLLHFTSFGTDVSSKHRYAFKVNFLNSESLQCNHSLTLTRDWLDSQSLGSNL